MQINILIPLVVVLKNATFYIKKNQISGIRNEIIKLYLDDPPSYD